MAEFPIHEVPYNPNDQHLRDLTTRELLFMSQTDQTPDPVEGREFAVKAFDQALAEFQADPRQDPAAAGEAAAKAGLRSAQLGSTTQKVRQWFDFSYTALGNARDEVFEKASLIDRERVATRILHGRALGYLATNSPIPEPDLVEEASTIFSRAEREISEQRMVGWFGGGRWDRYGSMLAIHRAANESRNQNSTRLHTFGIATVAAWRTVRAKKENVAEPTPEDAKKEHRDFVMKHLKGAAVVGALGLGKPRREGTRYDRAHKRLVGKILG